MRPWVNFKLPPILSQLCYLVKIKVSILCHEPTYLLSINEFLFCWTILPLTGTRWVWLTLSSLCPLFQKVLSINLSIEKNSWERQESSLGPLSAKQNAIHCAMQPPWMSIFTWHSCNLKKSTLSSRPYPTTEIWTLSIKAQSSKAVSNPSISNSRRNLPSVMVKKVLD